jgi:hypothetical protein
MELNDEQKKEIERLYLEEGMEFKQIKKLLNLENSVLINFIKKKDKDWVFRRRIVYKERTGRCKNCQVCSHKSKYKSPQEFNTIKEYLSHTYSIEDKNNICFICGIHGVTKTKLDELPSWVKQDEHLAKLYNFEYYEKN